VRKKAILMGVAAVAGVAVAATLCLSGCANLGYYWQTAMGHLNIMASARPVEELVAEAQTSPRLRERLLLSQRIRAYAVSELKLPDNPSYRRYADLHRNAAVWNVTAAPAYSLELKTWCFPVTGCVGYRGYYDEAKARGEASELAQEGYEVNVYPVTAYSTLGLMNWAGGDPAAQYLRELSGGRTRAPDLPRAGAPGRVREERHHLQRVVRHRGGTPGRHALAADAGGRGRAGRSTPRSTGAAACSASCRAECGSGSRSCTTRPVSSPMRRASPRAGSWRSSGPTTTP
jgi:hypothetical protein